MSANFDYLWPLAPRNRRCHLCMPPYFLLIQVCDMSSFNRNCKLVGTYFLSILHLQRGTPYTINRRKKKEIYDDRRTDGKVCSQNIHQKTWQTMKELIVYKRSAPSGFFSKWVQACTLPCRLNRIFWHLWSKKWSICESISYPTAATKSLKKKCFLWEYMI